jgi:hypothetical protein
LVLAAPLGQRLLVAEYKAQARCLVLSHLLAVALVAVLLERLLQAQAVMVDQAAAVEEMLAPTKV